MKNIVRNSIAFICCSAFLFLASCDKENIDETETTENNPQGSGNEFDCPELQLDVEDFCQNATIAEGFVNADCECVAVNNSDPDCPDFYIEGWSDGNVGSPCETGSVPQGGVINANCECEAAQTFDCPSLEANVGDICSDPVGNYGTINSNCECEAGEPLYDCPGLGGNVGDPCQGGWGVITSDCDCVENNTQACSIEGKWLLTNAGGSELLPNTMYEFQDGIRYTYYCLDGESCDWAAMTAADAIPGTNDYTFENNELTVDLNFGNIAVNDVEFECDCNVINLQYTDGSSWTWWRIGTNPNDCD